MEPSVSKDLNGIIMFYYCVAPNVTEANDSKRLRLHPTQEKIHYSGSNSSRVLHFHVKLL